MSVVHATHEGVLELGELKIPCAVLQDGTRVLSETGVVNALGLYRSGAVHTRSMADAADGVRLPLFVANKNIRKFVDRELADALDPIWFVPIGSGTKHRGVRADLIPKILDVWLRARDAGVLNETRQNVFRETMKWEDDSLGQEIRLLWLYYHPNLLSPQERTSESVLRKKRFWPFPPCNKRRPP